MNYMENKRRKDMMDDIFEELNNIIRSMFGTIPNPQITGEPHVWGFSMTQKGNEPPVIKEFGNMDIKNGKFMFSTPENQPGTHMESGTRKPLVDVMEDKDTLHVIVEMPGVNKEDIKLDCNGITLDIRAQNIDRKYYEHVELPARVLPDSANATYKNGVLEVIFSYDNSNKKSIHVN